MFKADYKLENGIYRTLTERPNVPLGQSSNFLPITATLYEPLWRKRSLSILTGGAFSTERELELMLEWLKPQQGQKILDAACSAGLYARTLLEYEPALEVHALDFSLPFLKKALEYAERDGVSPTLVYADVCDLPYKDNSFDALVCGGSLNEFTGLDKTLGEFARVLKPGSKMWQMYAAKSEGNIGKAIQGFIRTSGIRFIEAKDLEEKANGAGFKLLKAQYRGTVAMALFKKAS